MPASLTITIRVEPRHLRPVPAQRMVQLEKFAAGAGQRAPLVKRKRKASEKSMPIARAAQSTACVKPSKRTLIRMRMQECSHRRVTFHRRSGFSQSRGTCGHEAGRPSCAVVPAVAASCRPPEPCLDLARELRPVAVVDRERHFIDRGHAGR